MGHNRLGRLPKRDRWVQVVELLDTQPEETTTLAAAVTRAAYARLGKLANDSALVHCFWLLTRVTWAARSPNFASELRSLGLDIADRPSALTFVARVSDSVRRELIDYPPSGHFSDISSLALKRALLETVARQGPSLFDSSVDDFQRAVRAFSTREHFGELAHIFFADFLSRTLCSFVDRELANHVGEGRKLATVRDSLEFMKALDVHTRQSARIVRDFAGGWYSKHNWESKGEIDKEETQRFIAFAIRKLRSELMSEALA
jgi:hypothetical protein